jgi:hypothetical protein
MELSSRKELPIDEQFSEEHGNAMPVQQVIEGLVVSISRCVIDAPYMMASIRVISD